jgi:NAD(P)-dependent dehydrogenase (short-subunit alcohol dehydrogenase family)
MRPGIESNMQGRTVLVTGGTGGIGYETARNLVRRGARVARELDPATQERAWQRGR